MNIDELAQEGTDDSSDEDYNPELKAEVSGSEDESGGEGEESGNEAKKKRTKGAQRGPRKKLRNETLEKEEEEEKENSQTSQVLTEEEMKKKSDSLWADFLKDCDPPQKKSTEPVDSKKTTETSSSNSSKKPSPVVESQSASTPASPGVGGTSPPQSAPDLKTAPSTRPVKPELKKTITFAGEEVKVEKQQRGSGGLSAVLGKLGKGGKLTTLEKSKLDWETFKQSEGISEDLKTFNKGKSGYLERQDFLTRTDVRQFEIEKQLRSQRRTLNR